MEDKCGTIYCGTAECILGLNYKAVQVQLRPCSVEAFFLVLGWLIPAQFESPRNHDRPVR
jgi:hypothetical protein